MLCVMRQHTGMLVIVFSLSDNQHSIILRCERCSQIFGFHFERY